MVILLIILILSLIIGYAFLSAMFGLPFICLFPEAGIIVRMLNECVLKWSIVFSIVGIIFSCYCLLTKEYSSDNSVPKLGVLILYLLLFFILIL